MEMSGRFETYFLITEIKINMKKIFKSIIAVLSCTMLFASCMKEAAAPLATEISVDKQEVTFTGYAGSSAQIQKVQVTSNGDWFVTSSADWVTIKPTFGTAGVTNVEITVADNVDSYNELYGPRSTVVNFCYGTTGVAPLTVKQTGETGLDASRTYSLVKNQEDIVAGSYLIVFKNGDKHLAMEPLTASKTYGYLNAVEVTPEDDVITMPNASYAFTLEAVETGYNMIMADNRYIFMTGGYNSFNVSAAVADANPWTFTLNEDGTVQIAAVTHNNYIQYSTGYSSAGAYTSPQDGGLLPYLYKDAKAKSEEVLMVKDVTVPAFATSAKIKVQSNRTWSVRNHDEWIKTFTKKGKGEGVIEVTFDEYTSTTEARTATFQIIGEETNTFITFTQAKVAPAMTVEQFLAEDVAKGDFAILTGSIENIKNSKYGNFDLQDETGKVYVYGIYDVNGDRVFTEYGLKEGDIVTIYGVKDEYNGTLQMKNSVYVSHVSSKIRRKLAFDAETAEAKIGNPFTAPTLNGDATDVVYSSSDAAVATVDPATGEVTPLTEGTTTITANGPETETHLAGTASYTLTVTAKTPRALAFSAETAEATLGEEFTAPTLSGEAAGVVYSSSDTEVATVDPATGAVTLVAAGETTITATAAEDESFLAGTASYVLTVAEPFVPVIADGKYWIVAKGNVAKPLTSGYGYLQITNGKNNTADNGFTFTYVEAQDAYTIQDNGGQYYYQTGSYNSYNRQASLPTSGAYWRIEEAENNTYKITNLSVNKFVQFDPGYNSFGSYATQTTGLLPELVLVEGNSVPYAEVSPTSVIVEAEATSAQFTVSANMAWTAEVTKGAATLSTASGSADATVTVSFAANTSTEEAQQYEVSVTSEYGTQTVTITHKAVPAAGAKVIFEETFAKCNGVMGWSGSVANGTFAADNTGWTVANAYGAAGAAKFGASSKLGSAQTPALNFTGTATLTFRAGAWIGDNTNLKISMTGGTLSVSKVTLKNGDWTEYEVTITGATSGAKIKFEGNAASKCRFFLDDVKIVQND